MLVAAIVHAGVATVLLQMGLPELVDQAKTVGMVEVDHAAAAWEGKRIVTTVDARFHGVWKGNAKKGDAIQIRVPGGIVGGIGMRVVGAPEFTSGERYVVFLSPVEPSPDPRMQVVGFSQGTFHVVEAADSRGPFAVASLEGAALVGQTGGAQVRAAATQMRLSDLSREVARLVGSKEPTRESGRSIPARKQPVPSTRSKNVAP